MTEIKRKGAIAWVPRRDRGSKGSAIMTRAELGQEMAGDDWHVDVTWFAPNDSERAEPVSVTIGNGRAGRRPVTASDIRRLPLGTLMEMSRQALHREAADPIVHDDDLPAAHRIEYAKFADAGPQRGTEMTGDQVAEIASVYRAAWFAGSPVTNAVAEHFTISKSAASKRIMKARAAGLLDGIGPKR